MAVFKIACPECGATLKSANPMPPGKKVKCPKCGVGFTVPAGGDAPEGAEEEAARPKPAAKAAPAKKKAAPESPPPKPEDEEEGGTYKFIDEPERAGGEGGEGSEDDEEGEKKPDLTFALDLSVKDPRGFAQESVVRPSNWLVLLGGIVIVLYVVVIGYLLFPFFFSPHIASVEQSLGITAKEGEAPHIPEEKDWTPEQKQRVAARDAAEGFGRIMGMLATLVFVVVTGIAVFGAVKMQTLESWGWGLAATILMPIGALPVFLVTLGLALSVFGVNDLMVFMGVALATLAALALSGAIVWWTIQSLKVLLDPKVKEGFAFEQEEAKKRY